MNMMCIVNTSPEWGIGFQGKLLVSIRDDLKRFRGLTTGKTVILGRKTLETFPGGRPLKNRRNLILSADPSFQPEGGEVYRSLQNLLQVIAEIPSDEICVIGGDSIYRQLLPYCDTAEVTRSDITAPADTFFPALDRMPSWELVREGDWQEENGVRYQYNTWKNAAPLPIL